MNRHRQKNRNGGAGGGGSHYRDGKKLFKNGTGRMKTRTATE